MALTLATVFLVAATVKYVPVVWVAVKTEERMERRSIGVSIEGLARVESMAVYQGKVVSPGSPVGYLRLERNATWADQSEKSESQSPPNSKTSAAGDNIALIEAVDSGQICGHIAQPGDYVKNGQEIANVCVKGSRKIYSTMLSSAQASSVTLGQYFPVRLTTWRGKKDISNGLTLASASPEYAEDGKTVRYILLRFNPTPELEALMSEHMEVVGMDVGITQEETSIGRWMMSRMGMFAQGKSR
jgi:hypothetical protein